MVKVFFPPMGEKVTRQSSASLHDKVVLGSTAITRTIHGLHPTLSAVARKARHALILFALPARPNNRAIARYWKDIFSGKLRRALCTGSVALDEI